MFNPALLFPAFEAAGMLHSALREEAMPPASFAVGFVQPSQLILGEAVQSDQIEIEYETRVAVDLRVGERLAICGSQFVVRQPPAKLGDGFYSRAELERA